MYLNFLCVSGNNLRLNIHSKHDRFLINFTPVCHCCPEQRKTLASKNPYIAQSTKGVLDVSLLLIFDNNR